MEKKAWVDLMRSFGFADNEAEFNMIENFYQEKHRKYHNLDHIKDCLEKCRLNETSKSNRVLHLAFWYHDLIYKPFKKDNEQASADLAIRFIKKQTDDVQLANRIERLIMATLHNRTPDTIEEAYMMDIDLSILGSNKEKYTTYTHNIRKEYSVVPWLLYKKKRVEILERFLSKNELYYTDYFKTEFENKARLNIQNEIQQLKTS